MSNIPTGITPEMVEALVSNPGQTITPQDLKPQTFTPTQRVGLRNETKDIRPNVQGNKPNDGLIGGPSPNFATGLAKQAQKDAAAALKEIEENQKQKELLSTSSLRRDLEALRRQVKRLEKQLKETTNG